MQREQMANKRHTVYNKGGVNASFSKPKDDDSDMGDTRSRLGNKPGLAKGTGAMKGSAEKGRKNTVIADRAFNKSMFKTHDDAVSGTNHTASNKFSHRRRFGDKPMDAKINLDMSAALDESMDENTSLAERMFANKRKSFDRQSNQVRRNFTGRVSTTMTSEATKELLSGQNIEGSGGLRQELGGPVTVCQTPKVVPGHKLNKFKPSFNAEGKKNTAKDTKDTESKVGKFGAGRAKPGGTLTHAPSSATLKTDGARDSGLGRQRPSLVMKPSASSRLVRPSDKNKDMRPSASSTLDNPGKKVGTIPKLNKAQSTIMKNDK